MLSVTILHIYIALFPASKRFNMEVKKQNRLHHSSPASLSVLLRLLCKTTLSLAAVTLHSNYKNELIGFFRLNFNSFSWLDHFSFQFNVLFVHI
jgi:hypothetical protein